MSEVEHAGDNRSQPVANQPRPALQVGWMSDVGRMRDLNEDALYTLLTEFEQGDERQTVGVFVVADGMGGHEQGERASALAARTVAEEMLRRIVVPVISGGSSNAPLHETMRNAVMNAHSKLLRELPGAGTTLTVALVVGDSLAIAHVGDSRAYLFRDGQVEQLTRDHSLVARLVEMGQQSAEDAALDPRRNVLYRALGQSDALEVDFEFQEFGPGSRLLLCSDGLWGQVGKAELERVLRESDDPQRACAELIELANDSGGPDNITAIFILKPS